MIVDLGVSPGLPQIAISGARGSSGRQAVGGAHPALSAQGNADAAAARRTGSQLRTGATVSLPPAAAPGAGRLSGGTGRSVAIEQLAQ